MSDRLLVSPDEAAERLSVSRDTFDRWIRHELRVVRVGRKVLIPIGELEVWIREHSARTLEA